MYLIPGILGFIACCLFDFNKIRWHSKVLNCFFILGSLLLVFSTLCAVLQSDFSDITTLFQGSRLIWFLGCILSGIALIYILFFALPFDETYIENDTLPLVDKGVYALCRHPGFWMFGSFYLCLGFFLSSHLIMIEAFLYSGCNFLYIYIQDRYIFPYYIQGYDNYRKAVPFLVPNRNSIRKAFCQKGLNK